MNIQILYESIMDNLFDEVHIWELIRDDAGNISTWRLLEANAAALKSWGKKLNEIVGKTADEIFPDADATAKFKPIVEKIFKENKPYEWETYFEGTGQTLLMKSIPLGDTFISTGFDITELKKIQLSLEDSNLRLTESAKAGHIAIWDWNITDDIMTWDNLMYEIYGAEKSEHETVAIWENALHPEDSEMAKQAIKETLAGNKEYRLVFRIIKPSGDVRYIQGAGRVLRDNEGNPVRMLGTNIDITEAHLAEQQLKDTLLRLNESVKSGNVGIWEWDLRTNNVVYSKEYKAQLGYSEDEMGTGFTEWESRVHPDDLQPTLDKVNSSLKSLSKNHQAEFRVRHKDGHYLWILSHASVIPGEDGTPIKMIGTHIDITERKLIEEERRQSQKTEAIGQLAGGVAHDFNNQLGCIMGFAELLEIKLDDPELLKYVRNIIKAAQHSGNLTSQLLTFSRKQNINLESINIHQQLNDCIELLNRSIDKRITIETHFNAKNAMSLGDKSLLFNVFLNLALNARDAMKHGGKLTITTNCVETAEISTTEKLSGNRFIEIDFEDNGCGIAPENQTKIFDPFFTTKPLGEGTGMGLASVYGAIKQLGGIIQVDSQLDIGTCFKVFLPAEDPVSNKHEIVNSNKFNQLKTPKKYS